MNGIEFCAAYFARRFLPQAEVSGDAFTDAHRALTRNYRMPDDKEKRLNVGVAAIVKAGSVVINKPGYSTHPDVRVADLTGPALLRGEVLNGLNEPVILLRFTNALVNADDLRVTHDPRRARLVSPDGIWTFDALAIRTAEAGAGALIRGSVEDTVRKQLGVKPPRIKEAT
jgi:hypothetical protein